MLHIITTLKNGYKGNSTITNTQPIPQVPKHSASYNTNSILYKFIESFKDGAEGIKSGIMCRFNTNYQKPYIQALKNAIPNTTEKKIKEFEIALSAKKEGLKDVVSYEKFRLMHPAYVYPIQINKEEGVAHMGCIFFTNSPNHILVKAPIPIYTDEYGNIQYAVNCIYEFIIRIDQLPNFIYEATSNELGNNPIKIKCMYQAGIKVNKNIKFNLYEDWGSRLLPVWKDMFADGNVVDGDRGKKIIEEIKISKEVQKDSAFTTFKSLQKSTSAVKKKVQEDDETIIPKFSEE